jgi:hypothetical protein
MRVSVMKTVFVFRKIEILVDFGIRNEQIYDLGNTVD